jgi:hypothetical protein
MVDYVDKIRWYIENENRQIEKKRRVREDARLSRLKLTMVDKHPVHFTM